MLGLGPSKSMIDLSISSGIKGGNYSISLGILNSAAMWKRFLPFPRSTVRGSFFFTNFIRSDTF